MKGIKISKTGWLILAAGVFIVILAGLGLTRSQQFREQTRVNDELSMSQTRLDKIDVTDLRRQLGDLQQKVDEGQAQLDDARERLRQTVISVDITEELFKIAAYSDVTVMRLTTSMITPDDLQGIGLSTILVSAQAEGDLDHLVDFVVNLNNGYPTGYLKSAQITVPLSGSTEEPAEGGDEATAGLDQTGATVSIQMIVYSYEGE
jgi:hypothetical protein